MENCAERMSRRDDTAFPPRAFSTRKSKKGNLEVSIKRNIIAATIIFVLIFASWSSYAQRQPSECAGVLHKDRYGLRIGGGVGEDEGICLINKAEENKVLAICA